MRGHAAHRLSDRYGVHVGHDRLVGHLGSLVQSGGAKFRRHVWGGCSEWEAYVSGKRIRFIWAEQARRVVTVLPPRRRRARATPQEVQP